MSSFINLLAVDLTLDQASVMRLAEENATELKVAGEGLKASRAKIDLNAYPLIGPKLELNGGYNFDSENEILGFTLRQPLDIWHKYRRAVVKNEHLEMKAKWVSVRSRILNESLQTFYQSLHRQERVVIAKKIVHVYRELHEIAEQQKRAGQSSDLELGVAKMALGRSESQLSRLNANLALAKAKLKNKLNLAAEMNLKLQGDLNWPFMERFDKVYLKEDQHPQLLLLKRRLDRNRAMAQKARSEGWVDLDLGLGFRQEGSQDIVSSALGFSFDWPGRSKDRVEIAESNVRSRQMEVDDLKRQIEVQLQSEIEHFHQLRHSHRSLSQEVIDNSDDNLNMTRMAYQAGTLALGDVLSLQREQFDFQIEEIDLKRDLVLANLRIAELAGWFPFNTTLSENSLADKEIEEVQKR
jgi:cobalt-zinc-cadmium efflux system outer membrane protein